MRLFKNFKPKPKTAGHTELTLSWGSLPHACGPGPSTSWLQFPHIKKGVIIIVNSEDWRVREGMRSSMYRAWHTPRVLSMGVIEWAQADC